MLREGIHLLRVNTSFSSLNFLEGSKTLCNLISNISKTNANVSSNTRKHPICMHWRLVSPWFRGIDELGEDEFCRFRSAKSLEEEDALLSQCNPKSAQ